MIYIKYLKYVLEHKKNVFIECINRSTYYWNKSNEQYCNSKNVYRKNALQLLIHSVTHDLSKFNLKEFIPYARFFYGDYPSLYDPKFGQYTGIFKEEVEHYFSIAWEHHYKSNKHHPEHWNGKSIPNKYLEQMVCDLKGMSRKFGDTAQEYYLKNYYKWNLNDDTRRRLEIILELTESYNAPICECSEEYWETIGQMIERYETYYNQTGTIYGDSVEYCLNNLLKPACDKYKINIYKLVKGSKKKSI